MWLLTGLLGAAVILALTDTRLLARRALALAGIGLAVSLPAIVTGGTFVGTGNIGVLTSGTELGNLIRPLDRLQIFGSILASCLLCGLLPAKLGLGGERTSRNSASLKMAQFYASAARSCPSAKQKTHCGIPG